MKEVVTIADGENLHKYKFGVIRSNTPNAYMDKDTVILTDTLISLFDDGQLKCAGSHEVAHRLLGHYNKRLAASGTITAGMLVANAFLPGVGLLNHLVNPLVTNSFSRSQEMDADAMAVEIVTRMGLSKAVCIDMLQIMLDYSTANRIDTSGGAWSTHPDMKERIERLKQDN